jgi:hypothetical protein
LVGSKGALRTIKTNGIFAQPRAITRLCGSDVRRLAMRTGSADGVAGGQHVSA